MSSLTSWQIEERCVPFLNVAMAHPKIKEGLNGDLFRELCAAELYGILRSIHGYIYICFDSPVCIYMCLICRQEVAGYVWYDRSWFYIPWENYEWFCYRYLGWVGARKFEEEQKLDWRQVGF